MTFVQVSFERMRGDTKIAVVDATDTDSKQRDRRQEEAMEMRRGLSWYLQILMFQCAKERRDVNSSDCLQEAASNLNMMKLI